MFQHFRRGAKNFKWPQNSEDYSDLDENWIKSIAAMKTIISKKSFGQISRKNFAKTSRKRRRRGRWMRRRGGAGKILHGDGNNHFKKSFGADCSEKQCENFAKASSQGSVDESPPPRWRRKNWI